MNKKISMEELRNICKKWAHQIGNNYKPDLIIFIAKSGFIIADEFSKYFQVQMDEVSASRAGGRIRKSLGPIFSYLPIEIRNKIVGAKLMYQINGNKKERHVEVPDSLINLSERKQYQKILLIDDSIDTGWTFISAYKQIKKLFPYADISTLALIQMKYSKERFQVDYHLYEDILLLTPAQIDSSEYDLFIRQYEKWKNEK